MWYAGSEQGGEGDTHDSGGGTQASKGEMRGVVNSTLLLRVSFLISYCP